MTFPFEEAVRRKLAVALLGHRNLAALNIGRSEPHLAASVIAADKTIDLSVLDLAFDKLTRHLSLQERNKCQQQNHAATPVISQALCKSMCKACPRVCHASECGSRWEWPRVRLVDRRLADRL